MRAFLIALSLISFSSCNQNKGPEEVLKGLISKSLSGSINPENARDYFTGDALETQLRGGKPPKIKDISDLKSKIVGKSCSQDKCSLTYIVSYSFPEGPERKGPGKAQARKTAIMLLKEEGWRVSELLEVKSSIEFKDPL